MKRTRDVGVYARMADLCRRYRLHTVCQEANCPNQGECFEQGTATFMILGDVCTRNCRFCAVRAGNPGPLDRDEPQNIARAVRELELSHVVITSVTRDDLADGGAEHYARTAQAVRQLNAAISIEVLVPDFQGDRDSIARVVLAAPDVIGHNLETVPELYREVRPGADYLTSLELLWRVKALEELTVTKSGLMLGLGERVEQVIRTMKDLREVKCDILTLGQYLSPSPVHLPLREYISPEQFAEYRRIGEELGFGYVAAGPFVRSSFDAGRAARLLLAQGAGGKRRR